MELAQVKSMEERLAELEAQNAALQARLASRVGKPSMKVSDKGAVSLYGLGRFPVTLYASQWDRLLGCGLEIKSFIQENKSKLAFKE